MQPLLLAYLNSQYGEWWCSASIIFQNKKETCTIVATITRNLHLFCSLYVSRCDLPGTIEIYADGFYLLIFYFEKNVTLKIGISWPKSKAITHCFYLFDEDATSFTCLSQQPIWWCSATIIFQDKKETYTIVVSITNFQPDGLWLLFFFTGKECAFKNQNIFLSKV